jgi:peptide/nickel transport system permease protein
MTLTAAEQAGAAAARPVGAIEGRSPWQLAWARLRRDPAAIASAVTILLIAAAAAAAPAVAHAVGHGPDAQYPSVGLTTAGLVVGLVAGYFGGVVDVVLARFMDMVLSFPYLLLAIALVSVFGPSLTITVLVIAFFSWAAIGRVVRGQTLSIREQEYIEASWSVGSGALRVMFVEILPNLLAPVLVLATLLVPTAIVFEATLSFLGLGVVPPTPTWGGMLSDSLNFYQVAWWFPLFPGLALLATTLAFNLLGDSVRDALDPTAGRAAAGGDR